MNIKRRATFYDILIYFRSAIFVMMKCTTYIPVQKRPRNVVRYYRSKREKTSGQICYYGTVLQATKLSQVIFSIEYWVLLGILVCPYITGT